MIVCLMMKNEKYVKENEFFTRLSMLCPIFAKFIVDQTKNTESLFTWDPLDFSSDCSRLKKRLLIIAIIHSISIICRLFLRFKEDFIFVMLKGFYSLMILFIVFTILKRNKIDARILHQV